MKTYKKHFNFYDRNWYDIASVLCGSNHYILILKYILNKNVYIVFLDKLYLNYDIYKYHKKLNDL